MKSYYRVMLGRGSIHAAECFAGNFIGADFGIYEDLSRKLPEEWRDFNRAFIPVYQRNDPTKSKVSAGLACGALWRVSKGIKKGDIVLCPDGAGSYRAGELAGDYYYAGGEILPHRRKVNWLERVIARSEMSEALQNSTGSIGTVSNIAVHRDEIERLLVPLSFAATVVPSDSTIEDPIAFAMETHLESFLVENWNQTELGRDFLIYEEEGEAVGQQYETDAGSIDILAISKDRKRLLVVELKRGRATDIVVGQALRYMGYVAKQIAEDDQSVEGAIVALEDDQKLRWALAAVPSITFYRYQVSFKLQKIDRIRK